MRCEEGDGVQFLKGPFGHEMGLDGAAEKQEGEVVLGGIPDLCGVSIISYPMCW